jgi:hypothetical protein
VSWKDAAGARLSAADLDPYRGESSSRVLTPRPDAATKTALSALDAGLSAPEIADSVACLARALVLIGTAQDALEAARSDLRTRLLDYADAGYALRFATERQSTRMVFDHKAAIAELIHDLDIEAFTTHHRRLHITKRDTAVCAALFG